MSEQYVAAIDQGTTSTRCMIFNRDGRVVNVDQKEHEQIFPRAGWVEHDATEIWDNTREVVAGALAKADLNAADIAAVGITNQRETALVWDKTTGEPVYNAIVWQDTRTDAICKQLGDLGGGAERYKDKVGLPLATYFSGPKVRWILDNVDGAKEKARGRQPGVRQHGHLGALEHDRRRRRRPARHGPDERLAHDAHGPRLPELGRGHRGRDGHPAVDAAGDPLELARCTARSASAGRCTACRSPATSATSRPPRSARPACRWARPRTPTAPATSC